MSLGDWRCELPQKDPEGYGTLTNHIFIHITLHDFPKTEYKKHSPIFTHPLPSTIIIYVYILSSSRIPKLTLSHPVCPPHLLRDNGDAVAAETISTTSGAFSTTSAAFGGGAAALGADAVGGETTTAAGSAGAAGGCVDCVDCEESWEGLGKMTIERGRCFLLGGKIWRTCSKLKV